MDPKLLNEAYQLLQQERIALHAEIETKIFRLNAIQTAIGAIINIHTIQELAASANAVKN